MASSCLVPESPAVLAALEHLKELDRQLREDGAPFSEEGSVHLTAMAAAVSELEASRRAAREHLEVETIESSKLRHQIKNMSDRMSQDILADRAAARASNAEEIERLRRDLGSSSRVQEESGERLRELSAQNEALRAEREEARGAHEAAVASLNEQISLRYSRQQQLDHKLEDIEELRASVAAAEQETASLLQSMARAREAFSEEQESLHGKLDETVVRIKQQRAVVDGCRRELEEADGRKSKSYGRLRELSARVAELESSLQRCKASRCGCERQLQEEADQSQDLSRQVETLKEECRELEETFSLAVRSLQEDIGAVEEDIQGRRASGLLLKDSLARVCKVFRHRHEEEKEVRADHLRVSLLLERSRLQMEERVASIVRHNKESREMERQIQELLEEGRANRCVFESKREELRSDLDAVQSDIGQVKEELRELSVRLEEDKARQEEYEVEMTSDICRARKRYEELLREEAALLQLHPESADPAFLTERIAQTETELGRMQSLHQQEVQQITAETEKICGSTEERRRELEEREQTLERTEAKWSDAKTRHDGLSALSAELNRRRSELERSVRDTEERTRGLLQPREDMKAELGRLQEAYSHVLSAQDAELRAVEVGIYRHAVMLQQVRTHNGRMRLRSAQMAEDVRSCRQETQRYKEEAQEFNRQANGLLKGLQEAWKRDVSVVEDGERRDDVLLVSVNSVLKQLRSRNQQLLGVSALLHGLMLEFSRRLGDKAAGGRLS
ncbi:uncharacterized protein ccdc175 [Fundulus diaphanus]